METGDRRKCFQSLYKTFKKGSNEKILLGEDAPRIVLHMETVMFMWEGLPNSLSLSSLSLLPPSPVAMYREPSLHDVGETVPKAAVPPSKSTSEPAMMNGGKPVSKPDKPTT